MNEPNNPNTVPAVDKAPKRKVRPKAVSSIVRRVTMTDVALAAGCSQATVSFVLKNSTGVKISTDTRARVISAAIALGYAPPTFAHLDTGLSETADGPGPVGFLVDQLATSPEAVVAIDGTRQACWEAGHIVLVAQTMNDPQIEEKTIRTLLAQRLSGLIYMTIFTRRVDLTAILMGLSVPVVLLNCYSSDRRFPSVVPAEVAGGKRATEYLIAHGHRRIGMITGEPWMEATRDREKGYLRALTEAGVQFDPDLVVKGNWSASAGYSGTRDLLRLADRPTAIFCQNDRMAIGCYEALKEAGLAIPKQMSVIGYDDEEISRHLHPQLTTLILPHRAMGGWAAAQLAAVPANGRFSVTKIECALIERNSVAGPAGFNPDLIPRHGLAVPAEG